MTNNYQDQNCSVSCGAGACSTIGPLETNAGVTVVTDAALINNPASAIKTHAINADALYAAYNSLRNLAKPLNGLQHTDQIPAGLKIKAVRVEYELDGVHAVANISGISAVGELAPLIGPALRRNIADIRDELNLLDSVVAAVKPLVNSAAGGQSVISTAAPTLANQN